MNRSIHRSSLQQCVDYRRLDESGGEVTKEAKSWQAAGSSLGGKREELRRRIGGYIEADDESKCCCGLLADENPANLNRGLRGRT